MLEYGFLTIAILVCIVGMNSSAARLWPPRIYLLVLISSACTLVALVLRERHVLLIGGFESDLKLLAACGLVALALLCLVRYFAVKREGQAVA